MTSPLVHWARLATALALVALCALPLASSASAEQASAVSRTVQGGYLDAGDEHSCVVLADRSVRCWGVGDHGRLGSGATADVTSAAAAAPSDLGPGRSARAISAGAQHTCAILDDATVRCWGYGAYGRLGYASTADVHAPALAPPVDIGPGRTAVAITAGAEHTCVIRDDRRVVCWGAGTAGRPGYGNQFSIGDNETPGSVGPVDIGPGRTAVAIAAGKYHTCAIRDDGSLLCWGFGQVGQLGRGGTASIGDDETPGQAGPVDLGGRRALAVSGGTGHTCAVLDDGSARCWGLGGDGRLGYGSTATITSAAAAGPLDLGPGRTAAAIAAGEAHSCAVLDTGAVRCWGFGGNGRLGYGDTQSVGDDAGESPASAGPVALGAGRTARALTVGSSHTCAALDDGTLRCWGFGGRGRLGYGSQSSLGDSATRSVATAGPVPVAGSVPPLVADLSVAVTASAAEVPVGARAAVAVTVANAGVDTATGVVVAVSQPPGLTLVGASATQGSFAGGVWQVGSIAPGAGAVLSLTVVPAVSATHVVTAEVAASAVHDPDSSPGNGAAEDDRASVSLLAPAAVAAARPTGPPAPRRVSVRAVRFPRGGVAKRIAVTGSVLLPVTRPATRCAGRVRVRAAAGSRTVAVRTVTLRAVRGACRYSALLRPVRARSAFWVLVSARFLGTPSMRARTSRAVRVRIRPDRRPLPRALSASVVTVPRTGVARRIRAAGVLSLPRTRPAPRCAGRVQVRARIGGRTLVRTVQLRARGGACRYAATIVPPSPASARVAVVSTRFAGSPAMKPRAARIRSVRIR